MPSVIVAKGEIGDLTNVAIKSESEMGPGDKEMLSGLGEVH